MRLVNRIALFFFYQCLSELSTMVSFWSKFGLEIGTIIQIHLHCHKILLLKKIFQILWLNAAHFSWVSGLNSTTGIFKINIYWQRKMHDLLVSNLLWCPQCNAADGYLSFHMKKLVIYYVANKGTKRDRKGIKTVGKE